jgi:hypothetical protein
VDITRGEVSPGTGLAIASTVYSSLRPTTTTFYTPTITNQPSTCSSKVTISYSTGPGIPQTGSEMQLATNLPPTPDQRMCKCMMDSLDCVANHTYKPPTESVSPQIFLPTILFEDEKFLNGSICSKNDSSCLGSKKDTITGSFGAFSACNATERGSWILNRVYKSNNNDAAICSSVGGILREKGSARALSRTCRNVVEQAGPLGTGLISPIPVDDKNSMTTSGLPRTLSQGAKAGIGVGIALFLAIFSAALFLGLRRKQKKRIQQKAKQEAEASDGDAFGKAELQGTSVDATTKLPRMAEIGGEEVNEIDGYSPYTEVDTDRELRELPAFDDKPAELNGTEHYSELSADEYKPIELDATPKEAILDEKMG